FGKHSLGLQFRVLTKRLSGGLHGLLIPRGKRAQSVLHAIAELTKNNLWNVERILANEVDTDPFGTDQSYHLLNFLFNCRLNVRKQQMRFIKKEDQFRFFWITNFRKILE